MSLRLCEYFNIISAINHHISTTIQRRQQATALHRGMLNSHSRATAFQPPLCKGMCRTNVRRRDCKVDFIWFYKIPQSFFCKKCQLPLQGSLNLYQFINFIIPLSQHYIQQRHKQFLVCAVRPQEQKQSKQQRFVRLFENRVE